MSIFQIIAVCFALFMSYVIHIHHRKARLSLVEVSFWYSSWFLFVVISLFPELLTGISGVLKFQRVFDLLVVIAFMVISVVVFYTYFLQRETHQKIEGMIRELAIKNKLEKSEEKRS